MKKPIYKTINNVNYLILYVAELGQIPYCECKGYTEEEAKSKAVEFKKNNVDNSLTNWDECVNRFGGSVKPIYVKSI